MRRIPKKYYNFVALYSYAMIVIPSVLFYFTGIRRGWFEKGVEPLLNPLGFVAMGLAGLSIVLFVWSIRRECLIAIHVGSRLIILKI